MGPELAPALRKSYLAFSNALRLDLQALGINHKDMDKGSELDEYVERKYGKGK